MEPTYSTYEMYAALRPADNPPNPPYGSEDVTKFQDDGIWLISCSFSIWTMVSGFGLLESGRVSSKDEVNIMVKNVVDVVFGGLSYWMFGFGFTYGKDWPNGYIGVGHFFYDPDKAGQPSDQAWHYARFFFQMSFATTTSTIVSAAMAERIRLKPYIVITYLMTLVHSITAHWIWSEDGFLYKLGVVDAAGCSVVHLVGGVAGLASTLYLKPRQARFGERGNAHMSNPTNALLGTFMLWWGWLAFNTGSTLGVANNKWRLAARSAMVTLLSSIGGGCTSIVISLIATRKCQIDLLIDGLLASLVATTAGCHSLRPFDSLAVGAIGAALALSIYPLVERLEIDDPVGVIPVHVVGATWGMLCVGIFSQEDKETIAQDPRGKGVTKNRNGLIYSGDFELLMIQAIGVICIFAFSLVITFLSLVIMNQFPWGLRMTKYEEQLGADLIEHGLAGHNIAKYSIEKKLNVKNAYSVIKFVAKWKRLARKARERRIAELAAARGEDPQSDGVVPSTSQQSVQPEPQSSGSGRLRLGPLKLGALRRPSNLLSTNSGGGSSGTLSARPKSTLGRRPIEKEKNSLPPMNSSRIHPLKTMTGNTSLDLDGQEQLPNGIPGNGSIPLSKPITVITPSSPTPNAYQQERMPPLQIHQEESSREELQQQHQRTSRNDGGGSRSIIGRFRRGGRVSPRREEIPLQEHPNATAAANSSEQPQASPQSPRLPPISARSTVASAPRHQPKNPPADSTVASRRGGVDGIEESEDRTATKRQNINDSIV